MWPVLANQLVLSRAAQKRFDRSSDVGRIPATEENVGRIPLTEDKKTPLMKMPPRGPEQKVASLKGGWLKRIAARNFFVRAQ